MLDNANPNFGSNRMSDAKICLFVPHSTDAGGVGEYMRCLNIANVLNSIEPEWRIRFVLHKDAPYFSAHPYEVSYFSGPYHNKQTHRERERVILNELKLKPSLVVFDSCGNGKHFLHCRGHGIPTMYISAHRGAKSRAFRLPGLMGIDLHWIVPTYPGDFFLNQKEKFLSKIFSVRIKTLSTVYHPEDIDGARKWLDDNKVDPRELVTFIPGGGMYYLQDKPAAQWFLSAAESAESQLTCKCLLITGKKFSHLNSSANVLCVDQLPNSLLMGILKLSRVAIIGAGDLVIQCLSLKVPVIAIPLGPDDQELRSSQCAARELIIKTSHNPQKIVESLQLLCGSSEARNKLINNMENLDLNNGALDIVHEIQRTVAKTG